MRARPMPLRRAATLLLGLALGAGGCTGAETGAETGGGLEAAADRSGDPPVDGAHEVDDDEEVDDLVWSSPISEALGGALAYDEAEIRAHQIEVAERTVACMAEEGFTYHPRPPAGQERWAGFDLPPDEFAATYGFAITTTDDTGPDGGAVEDPNAAMLAEMTPAEQDAWHDALLGPPEPIPEGDDFAPPRIGGGCEGRAWEESSSDEDHVEDVTAAFEPLLDEIASVSEQIERDPRLVAAREAYPGCMADAGHPGYSVDGDDPPSAAQAVRERRDAAIAASETGGEDALEQVRVDGGALSTVLPADVLAELRAFEIELAVADRPCSDAYHRVRFEVMTEHETRWVEANRAELEAYRDAMYPEGER